MADSNENASRVQKFQHRKEPQKKKMKLWKKIILWILAIIVAMVIFGAGLFTYYASSAPKISYNTLSSDNSTTIYDSKGKVISRLGAQNRDYVKQDQIPDNLKNAIISIEDRHFYKDHGVDPARIVEAAFSNIRGNGGLQGGSTLTQQLVKLSVFSTKASDQTIKRKAQEAWLAVKVDHDYSKQQILEFYINKVYMGNNAYGMQTASDFYFNKPLNKINLSQTAFLAGLPQAPVQYNPYTNPKLATDRRNQVLEAMASNKVITREQANQAEQTSITDGLAKKHTTNSSPDMKNEKYADAYIQQVVQELDQKGYKLNAGNKVYTNLNMDDQKQMYNLANNPTSPVQFPNNNFQIGATMVNSNNGKVVSMLGSRKQKIAFGLNRAVQTDRSSGSTMKPLMDYGPAIEYLKWPTYQAVQDTPFTYPGTNKELQDFDNKHEGTITMRKALVESRNIPAIRTLQQVGIQRSQDFLSGLGMTFDKPLELQNGIGAYISSEQEAAAYAAFANGGTYYKPYLINKVVNVNGAEKKFSSKGHRAMSQDTAFMMNDMLKGVMTSSNGSGTAAKIPGLYEAGKTGTTQYPDDWIKRVPNQASMDSWFTGYTKNLSLSIWTGYDHQFKPGNYISEQQTRIAQTYYKEMMSQASVGQPNIDWQKPDNVVETRRDGVNEYYIEGHMGTAVSANNNASQSGQASKNRSVVSNSSSSKNSSSSSSDSNSSSSSQTSSGSSSKVEEPNNQSSSESSSSENNQSSTNSTTATSNDNNQNASSSSSQ